MPTFTLKSTSTTSFSVVNLTHVLYYHELTLSMSLNFSWSSAILIHCGNDVVVVSCGRSTSTSATFNPLYGKPRSFELYVRKSLLLLLSSLVSYLNICSAGYPRNFHYSSPTKHFECLYSFLISLLQRLEKIWRD